MKAKHKIQYQLWINYSNNPTLVKVLNRNEYNLHKKYFGCRSSINSGFGIATKIN